MKQQFVDHPTMRSSMKFNIQLGILPNRTMNRVKFLRTVCSLLAILLLGLGAASIARAQAPGASPSQVSATPSQAPKIVQDRKRITSSLEVRGEPKTAYSDIKLNLRFDQTDRPAIGDLVVKLHSPQGKMIPLHKETGGDTDTLVFIGSALPSSRPQISSPNGIWTLSISDRKGRNVGTLVDWGLSFPKAKPAKDLAKGPGSDPIITEPILIWDLAANAPDPRNLRLAGDLKDSKNASQYDLTGLDNLRASGSSTYSTRGLGAVLKRIADASGAARPDVTVFELRQEFHGFFDGVSVSWLGTYDWSNRGKTHHEVVDEERALLESISKKPQVMIADEADVKKLGDAAPRRTISVARVQTEQEIVAGAGAHYVRLTITDQMGPTSEEVDRFLEEVRKLKTDAWAHMHCHAGRGRTTTFMILYDILRNAHQVKLEDISKRQGALAMLEGDGKDGNDFDLLNLDYDKMPEWKRQPAKDRADFIRRFYEFVLQADPLRTGTKWSEWIKR